MTQLEILVRILFQTFKWSHAFVTSHGRMRLLEYVHTCVCIVCVYVYKAYIQVREMGQHSGMGGGQTHI